MFDRKMLGIRLRAASAGLIGKKMARARLRAQYYKEFQQHHPHIEYDTQWRQQSIKAVHNESGFVFGQVVNVLKALPASAKKNILLAGESAQAKQAYSAILGVPVTAITTAGLHDDADKQWNFEQNPPALEPASIIVSHAILEHLIDPYKHVCDLVRLLAPGGYLILYTVIPGFPYHRYPVDCLRFFPDWFVEVAKRNNVSIHNQYIGEDHLVFTFRK